MGLGNEVQKILSWTSVCGDLVLHLVWLILHFIINVWYSVLGVARMVENTLISNGLLKSYNAVNISKVRYLAVVIESEEARETSKVLELLCWLASIGIKSVCLYDREGMLKKSQTAIIEGLNKSQKAIVEGLDHGTFVETYGDLKVHEIWFPYKSHPQIHNGASKLWPMNTIRWSDFLLYSDFVTLLSTCNTQSASSHILIYTVLIFHLKKKNGVKPLTSTPVLTIVVHIVIN